MGELHKSNHELSCLLEIWLQKQNMEHERMPLGKIGRIILYSRAGSQIALADG